MAEFDIHNTKRVVTINTVTHCGCDHCDFQFSFDDDWDQRVNHYLQEHRYRLLHVGSEWGRDNEGKSIQYTTGVVGHDNPPPLKPRPKVEIVEYVVKEGRPRKDA